MQQVMETNVLAAHYEKYAMQFFGKKLDELNPIELDNVIASVIVKEVILKRMKESQELYSKKRIVVYNSIEFLMGRTVLQTLNNLGLKNATSEILDNLGIDINCLEDVEDTALGNGGLGRLAACFIESAATLGIPVLGNGIFYNYGLFKQYFENNLQMETKDDWARFGTPWFTRVEDESVIVTFYDTAVKAVPYELPIVGYHKGDEENEHVYPLTLWKAEGIDGRSNESATRISDYLYPNDSDYEGKKLRLRQEYFFMSAMLQRMFKKHLEKHGSLDDFEEYYVFQMNDTHPVIGCVEFIRLLMENGYSFKEASSKAKKCFAYTNHTIMNEALEKWEINLFASILSQTFNVIQLLNQELIDSLIGKKEFQYPDGSPNWNLVQQYELFRDGWIYMDRIACYVGFAINGVAEVHSEIIKESTLNKWYKVYPDKFTNCTNGVTQRLWVLDSNPMLAKFLDTYVGPEWITNMSLVEALDAHKNETEALKQFAECKMHAKQALADYIEKQEGIKIDVNSIFDCHVKRIHLYKRQLMNAMRILYIYDGIKSGRIRDFYPTTFIIGGKAASGYYEAKLVINLIKDIQQMINNDPAMDGVMKVVYLTNFNVSYSQKVYSGANFSEQISTAGTEASGTSNMKFMMNGAPTIGTLDGANIEIVREAGIENNYIFGATVDELENLKNTYRLSDHLRSVQDFVSTIEHLKDGSLPSARGDRNYYRDLVTMLTLHDEYFVMYDLPSYVMATLMANHDYRMEQLTGCYFYYTKKGFMNTAHSGKFSSDRTIMEYAKNIWHVDRC